MDTTLARRLYGTDEPAAAVRPLRAGPLSMALRLGKLSGLRCGDREVWHGLAFVFRDPDWGTPEPVFEHECIELVGDGFRATLEGRFPVRPPVRLSIRIEGDGDGRVRFDAEAVPEGDIECNRIGLCLLHPADAAGAAIEVRHVDGRTSRSTLPRRIPPWPPFTLVRAIAHEWNTGMWADGELLGDSFELEDQRNNGDASFKTYGRSNLMPRPFRLPGGVPIRQSARLSLRPTPTTTVARKVQDAVVVAVESGTPCGPMPRVGIEVRPEDTRRRGTALLAALRVLRPAHLHLSLFDRDDARRVDADGLAALLDAAGAELRLDVGDGVGTDGAQAAVLAALAPSAVAVFPSDARRLADARRVWPRARVGGGTPHFFAQLHRLDRLDGIDFVSFTTSPLVHGADDDEVMLGLSSLPAMIETLRARWPGLPVHVGPSIIGVRRSPLGGQPDSDGTRRLALAARDPRCGAQFGAAWAAGHVAALAACDVEALTLMSLDGASAIWIGDAPTPAGHLLARLARPARRLRASSSAPRRVAALVFETADGVEALLANLGQDTLAVHVAGLGPAAVWRLDAEADGWRRGAPSTSAVAVRLPPYGIARLSR